MVSSTELRADAQTLDAMLQVDIRLAAPLFQRRFAWTKEQVEGLLRDLLDIVANQASTGHFIGTIILQRAEELRTGFGQSAYWIVDGQQRLLTLTTFLAAAASYLGEDDPASRDEVVRKYIVNQFKNRGRPKLRPTHLDTAQFDKVLKHLQSPEIAPDIPFGEPSGRLVDAYERARNGLARTKGQMKLEGDDWVQFLNDFTAAIVERLKFVVITLGIDDDPYQVFASLNEKGLKLSTTDLVRNEVFTKLADDPEAANALFNSSWLPFESRLGVRELDGYFFPYALAQDPKGVTKNRLFSELRSRWAKLTPEEIVVSLGTFVPPYVALRKGELGELSEPVKTAYAHLYRLDLPRVALPLFLAGWRAVEDGEADPDELVRIARWTEAFLVRRAVMGLEPTGLHAVFKEAWARAAGKVGKLDHFVRSRRTVAVPSDEEFRLSLVGDALYGRRSITRYFLGAYERSTPGADKFPDDVLNGQLDSVATTIHHVMPQSLGKGWKIRDTKKHESLKHTVGNLVLITRDPNVDMSNRSWAETRHILASSDFRSTRLLGGNATWTTADIRERSERIAEWAVNRWSLGWED